VRFANDAADPPAMRPDDRQRLTPEETVMHDEDLRARGACGVNGRLAGVYGECGPRDVIAALDLQAVVAAVLHGVGAEVGVEVIYQCVALHGCASWRGGG